MASAAQAWLSLLSPEQLAIAVGGLPSDSAGDFERRRWFWAGPLVLFGHALTLTQSRGGFLAMLTALLTFLAARFGRRAIPLLGVVLPPVFLVFAAVRKGWRFGIAVFALWAVLSMCAVLFSIFGSASLLKAMNWDPSTPLENGIDVLAAALGLVALGFYFFGSRTATSPA